MGRNKITMARFMVIIAIIALDFWIMRITYKRIGRSWDPGALSLVPCIEIAAILAITRGGRARRFWLGFLISALLELLLYSGIRGPFHRIVEWLPQYIYRLLDMNGFDLYRRTEGFGRSVQDTIFMFYGIVLMGIPLLVIPTLVGFATHFATARPATGPPAAD